MATYAELLQAQSDNTLNLKIRVACIIAAEAVRTANPGPSNQAARLAWAKRVFEDPRKEGERMIWAVLAQNASATLAQITGASDATVQTAVNAAVDVFAN